MIQVEALQAQLAVEAVHDPLTQLFNRRYLDSVMPGLIGTSDRRGAPLALALVDLDHFKSYNDSLGHPQGDRCIREVARLLRAGAQRANDLVGRYGGEEFLLLLPGTDAAQAARVIESVRAELARRAIPHPAAPGGVVTFSAGVASCVPAAGQKSLQLVARADSALYRAKSEGRDRVVVGG